MSDVQLAKKRNEGLAMQLFDSTFSYFLVASFRNDEIEIEIDSDLNKDTQIFQLRVT